MDVKPLLTDVLLDPTDIDFAKVTDKELIHWMRLDVPEAVNEFNRRVAQRQQ